MSGNGLAAASGRRFTCPDCGGGLTYDILSGEMKCDACGRRRRVSDLPREKAGGTMAVTAFRCPQCGAELLSADTEATAFCSFCGSDVVLTGKLTDARRPDRIVPFKIDREKCERIYREHLDAYPLAPSDLKTQETVSRFRPVYIPFWDYHVRSSGPVTALEGFKTYTQGDYRYEEQYALDVTADIDQTGILYDASTAFEDETAARLRHDIRDAVPFHPAYLSGAYAQVSDVTPETYRDEAVASAARHFMEKVRKKMDLTSVGTTADVGRDYGLKDVSVEQDMVMMPVWLLAKREGGRVMYTAVNGRTGEVVCDVPVSLAKAAALTAALAAAIFALLSFFLTLRPDWMILPAAALALTTLILAARIDRERRRREDRAGEPVPGQAFKGPAQMYLEAWQAPALKQKKAIEAKSAGSGTGCLTAFVKGVGMITLLSLGSVLFSYLTLTVSESGGDFRGVRAAVLAAGVIAALWYNRKRGDHGRMPDKLSILICGLIGLAAVLIPAGVTEDMVYYGLCAAILGLTVAELTLILRRHNRFVTRPVPFFDGKEERA